MFIMDVFISEIMPYQIRHKLPDSLDLGTTYEPALKLHTSQKTVHLQSAVRYRWRYTIFFW